MFVVREGRSTNECLHDHVPPAQFVDLRGLGCELMSDGREQCFMEDSQGRELCPTYVTSAYLATPPEGVRGMREEA
jgi:hypothetical protein